MSSTAKASDHVKPCNIAQSENHNRRDADYIKSLNPAKLYIRVDLSKNNTSYVAPEMEGISLQQHYDHIKEMVKLKTKRAMQEKDVEYTDKKGKVRVRKGCSPIRESVVNIKEDTSLEDLLNYTQKVESRWGIKAIQIHLHKDEGHYENPEDKESWKPNYHAHIIWDWMDHQTGKSFKLDANDMSEMQDLVAGTLDMERGQKKSETGLDHLERNDYIIQKQENKKKMLEEENRKALAEKDKAETEALEAMEEKDEAVEMTKKAKAELANIDSQVTSKKSESANLDTNISKKRQVLDQLRTEARDLRDEIYSLKNPEEWTSKALLAVSSYLLTIDQRLLQSVIAIQDYAYSGSNCRGGHHGDILDDAEASMIKSLMIDLANLAQCALLSIADWLIWVAKASSKGGFNQFELNRAKREVHDIAKGNYDWRIQRFEQKNGLNR